ncbi:MAG: hypothetical protein HOL17_12165 [Gammaproteobacteria bacterium]|nr:hypothetical protein [Gammaproteobacteria bacterium]MBT3951583.1 hypothetical protein [Candidatus Neomarinimicrobiota bacterium]MBT4608332.1 hypothetical protein [Thiotrichales bacterium]MBT3718966.1 hypothetical protein [Gammaproteobacteria bacterium]MBT3846216.1 hypothetical protein [Gammaproteobacteria bacterium]
MKAIVRFLLLAGVIPSISVAEIIDTVDWAAIAPGNEWTYNNELYSWDTTRDSVGTNSIPINGVETWPYSSSEGTTQYFSTNNGIRLHRLGGLSVYISGFGTLDYYIDASPAIVYAPATMSPGDVVNSSGTATYVFPSAGVSYPISYTSSSTFYGFEDVETVLGTFRAVKIQVEFSMSGSIEGENINETARTIYWLVKGLGIVKQWVEQDSETWVLKNTNIPESSYQSSIADAFPDDPLYSQDSDLDGLPDEWETDRIGDLSSSEVSDSDGDGFTAMEEFTAGTDPLVVTVQSGFNQADIDAAVATAISAAITSQVQACADNPASCGITISQSITSHSLVGGWNLIGGMDASDSASIQSFLDEHGATSVWGWDGLRWSSYLESTPVFLNSLTEMKAEEGYFVRVP